jgi:hypothetical protein
LPSYKINRVPFFTYHFDASLKDLGKKWFAFSRMDIGVGERLRKLDGMG